MTPEQEKVLKLAIDAAFGLNKEPSREEIRMILSLLMAEKWPEDGFPSLAKEIILLAITRTGPYADL